MAFRLRFWKQKECRGEAIGKRPDAKQDVCVGKHALEHMLRWRQWGPVAREAGGQMFGVVSEDRVDVLVATGPYRGDERQRFHYRSNPTAAQRAIESEAARGLLYLGEWHTHAETFPSPSPSDRDAIATLHERSKLATSSLLMVIVGKGCLSEGGLAICSFGPHRKFVQWDVAAEPN